MSREPALTYEGALRILGRKDHKWLERLNALLGGVILTAGVASLGAPAAAAPVLEAVLGWLEPKNEAVKLVRKAVDALPGRLRGVAGLERRELIIAAHSTIVVAAYFEALQEAMGRETYELLELTAEEQRSLAFGAADVLYTTEIPAPSSKYGYTENLGRVEAYLEYLDVRVRDFVLGLADVPRIRPAIAGAIGRYESFFLRLAETAPEFRIWAELTEHSATREKLAAQDEAHGQALDLLQGQTEALARLEGILLRANPTVSPVLADQRTSLAAANRAALDEMIVPGSAAQHYGRHLVFPKVRDMFVNPRYQFAEAEPDSRLADERWWQERPVRDDLDLRLIAHITSAEATNRPMLVLGHPGAGKSMLTRVLAARLPQSAYTVVRVPLRHVGAHSPVFHQIQDALNRATNGRVVWQEVVEQSLDTVRIVILDGLDELLHQAESSMYGYLRAVQEFQRTELAQGRPVIVLVTSRTLVTDRVDVPDETPVIKLEEFDDAQIAEWLQAWNTANAAGIKAGTTRALELKVALAQRDLTRQPLLLMMMAIYVADPQVAVIDEKISPTELYSRILTHFAEREAAKSPRSLNPDEVRADVEDQLRQLSIAALGMFNRGRQDISAEELGTDLAALEKIGGNAAEAGHRVLGKFFFVYVAEARFAEPDSPQRRYEFLHATFGEYLVARLVVEELCEVARAAFSSRRGVREPEDDLLFALLSFEPLSTRQPTLKFAREMCAGMDEEDREHIVEVLMTLIAGHRDRHGSDKYQDYRPRPVDRVRELAAYTANLVLLLVAIHPDRRVNLWTIHEKWLSMLHLWQSGLDSESYNGVLSILTNEKGRLRLVDGAATPGVLNGHLTALLAGDRIMAAMYRYGYAFAFDSFDARPGDTWSEVMYPWLSAALARQNRDGFTSISMAIPDDEDPELIDDFCERLAMLLKSHAHVSHIDQLAAFVRILLDNDQHDPVALASAVLAQPPLLTLIPELNDPALYSTYAARLMFMAESPGHPLLEELCRQLEANGSLGKVPDQVLQAVSQLMGAYSQPPGDHVRASHVTIESEMTWDPDDPD